MFGIDSFNSTPILPTLNMPSHSFTLHTENAKTFLAQSTEAELLAGYVPATDESGNSYVLQNIQSDYCPDVGTDEDCSAGPFSQFTIRGNEGDASTGRWHWGNGGQSLFVHDWDGDDRSDIGDSGAVEIDISIVATWLNYKLRWVMPHMEKNSKKTIGEVGVLILPKVFLIKPNWLLLF